MTIGQAFELAYKKFLDTSGKDLETQKQQMVMQKRVALLENENQELKRRLRDIASIKGQADIADYLAKNNVRKILKQFLCNVDTSNVIKYNTLPSL